MSKRKIMALALGLSVFAILAVGGTLAYFTDTEEANNTFTVGSVEIELKESEVKTGENEEGIYSYVDDDGDDRTVTENKYENLLPGSSVCKDPTVTNVGINDAYVRVKIKHNNAAAMYSTFKSWDEFYNTLTGIYATAAKASKTTMEYDGDTAVHTLWFTEPLAKDESITLFTSIEVPTWFDKTEMEAVYKDLEIDITADAIQASGFDSVEDAFAAFDTQRTTNPEP